MKDLYGHVGFAFFSDGPLAAPRMRQAYTIFQIQWNLKIIKSIEKMKDPYGHVGFAFFRDGPLAGPSMRQAYTIFQIQWNLKTAEINQNR